MKRFLVSAALAVTIASCGNGSNADTQHTEDTTSPASGASGQGIDGQGTRGGTGSGTDTTGLDVGAAQPVDTTANSGQVRNEPGAKKSGVKENERNLGGTGDTGTGGTRTRGQ